MKSTKIDRRHFLNTSVGMTVTGGSAALAARTEAPVSDGSMPVADTRRDRWKGNSKIMHDRKVALDTLKPSEKELQHGLALHADSLVIEPYGFSPRAAIHGDLFREALEAGASDAELADREEDMYMTRCVSDPREQEEFKQAWEASGVTCVFQNAGEEGQDPLRLIKRLARYTYVTDMLRDFVYKAVVPDDIVAAKEQNKRCLYFSGNGVPLTQQWVSTHDELRYVRIFFQLGIRMMHLTYNRRNMIGDGCAERANGGLSDFGRAAVAEMNRVGVIPDVAHSGWQTSLETAQVSHRPVVASHTTCTARYNHIRSKPDEVIRAICDTGGFVGICCISEFLGGDGNIATMLDHIDYVAKNFGVDHVAIATDLTYVSRFAGLERKKIPTRLKSRKRWASLWPPEPFRKTQTMRDSMAWTNWPLFTVGLVQRGYSDADIQKIIGGNALRVARAALK